MGPSPKSASLAHIIREPEGPRGKNRRYAQEQESQDVVVARVMEPASERVDVPREIDLRSGACGKRRLSDAGIVQGPWQGRLPETSEGFKTLSR